jgi:hypothetical protein
MRKIINGKRYDTESARLVGEYENSLPVTDFHHVWMGLYCTPRSGQYFLAGEGGPMTRFSQSAGQNSWTGGSDIIPMTRQEALEWAERHLDSQVVENEFSDLIEDA